MQIQQLQQVFYTAKGRPFLLDAHLSPCPQNPSLLFLHGFKGFKDWGAWNTIAQAMALAGVNVFKLNFSGNGTTLEQPHDFADPQAFGHNTYEQELQDAKQALLWLSEQAQSLHIHPNKIFLAGHSRGGAIALLTALENPLLVRGLLTWASIAKMDWLFTPENLEQLTEKGVFHVLNQRTGQALPIYANLYQDYQAQQARYDLLAQAAQLSCPWLILHGTADPAVSPSAAEALAAAQPQAQLQWIEGADHVFGAKHPFVGESLPAHSQALVEASLAFIQAHAQTKR
jgi:pimeloyl-ACP methyl ester carboxylesterase